MMLKNKVFSCILLLIALVVSVSCKKQSIPKPDLEIGTVTDVDNNTYTTVKIGNQWWMTENLRVKHYRNGRTIVMFDGNGSYPDSLWAQTKTGASCIYGYANSVDPVFGLLYNWYTISDTNNIAPAGWHVPSDDEWKALEVTLGMSPTDADNVKWRGTDEADKIKIASPQLNYWAIYGNVWSTNETGFSAVGGCCRLFNATWGDPGLASTGFWWSSSVHTSDNEVWYRYLDYKNENIFRYHGSKNYGMSIRCVKD